MTAIVRTILVAASLLALSGCTSPGPDLDELEDHCHRHLKAQLRYPPSARFSDEKTQKLSETRYEMQGIVDSENAFGAMVRSTYICSADLSADGTWTIVGARTYSR